MLSHADVDITLKIYHHVNARAIEEMRREYSPIGDLLAVCQPTRYVVVNVTAYRILLLN